MEENKQVKIKLSTVINSGFIWFLFWVLIFLNFESALYSTTVAWCIKTSEIEWDFLFFFIIKF